jgi:L-alanine-DL-glutamate epimerase-like enolase superfamily enzyme
VEGFRPYLDNQVLDMIHPDVAYSGGITGCRKIADYAALTRTPMGMHSGPCSLIRFYASMHLGAATQNFFKVENALGAFRGNKEKMAQGPEPAVRKSVFLAPGAYCQERYLVGISDEETYLAPVAAVLACRMRWST